MVPLRAPPGPDTECVVDVGVHRDPQTSCVVVSEKVPQLVLWYLREGGWGANNGRNRLGIVTDKLMCFVYTFESGS